MSGSIFGAAEAVGAGWVADVAVRSVAEATAAEDEVSSAEEGSSSSAAAAGSISIVAPRFTANMPVERTERAAKRMKPVEGRSDTVATIPISPMLARKKWMGTQEGQRSVRPLKRGRMKYPTP